MRRRYSRRNQAVVVADDGVSTGDLVVGGLLIAGTIGIIALVVSTTNVGAVAASSLGIQANWPVSQFTPGNYQVQSSQYAPGVAAGTYVVLNDATTGYTVIVQVTGSNGTSAIGTVVATTPGASENVGDTANFYVADVLAGASSLAQAQNLQAQLQSGGQVAYALQ
jgi:uncharacterized membrane protein